MAQGAIRPDISARINHYLAYLSNVMDDLPEIDAEWDTWDDHEQLDFVIEWDIERDRLGQLEIWAMQGLLSGAQERRYRELLDIVDERRPILDRLLAE